MPTNSLLIRAIVGAGLGATLVLGACSSSTTAPTPPPPVASAPQITCPAAVTVQSADGRSVPVVYTAPVVTGGATPVTTTCTPPSGSSFSLGPTTVTCTATDSLQRTATCDVTMTVKPPPKITVTRFLAFGDSMTVGEDGAAATANAWQPMVAVANPYPSILSLELTSRYTSQTILMTNAGLRGEPLALYLPGSPPPAPPRFSQLIASGQYDIALILEGANDLLDRDDRDIPPAIAALRTMVRDAKSRGIKVVLATLPPQNPQGFRALGWSLVQPFNDQLKGMAVAESVPVADVYAAFNGDLSLLSGDGLHPNQAGYQKVADTFFATIKQNFEPAQLLAPSTFAVPRRR